MACSWFRRHRVKCFFMGPEVMERRKFTRAFKLEAVRQLKPFAPFEGAFVENVCVRRSNRDLRSHLDESVDGDSKIARCIVR